MKKIFTLLLLLSTVAAQAQIQVGSNPIPHMNNAGRLSARQLEKLKKTTTVFTLQVKDWPRKAEFEKAIRSVWTITPFKIIRPEEIKNYVGGGYSIFSFGGYSGEHRSSLTSYSNTHFTYDLWIPVQKNNGNIKQEFFCRVYLSPNNKLIYEHMRNRNMRQKDYSAQMLDFIYNKGEFFNWGPGFLKAYLKEINDHLLAGEEQGPYSEIAQKDQLEQLQHDTLYIPDYVFIRFNPLTGSEKSYQPDKDELHKDYPFPVKMVTSAVLNKMILSGRSFNYLVYVKSSTDKYINVYNSKTGEMLYSEYSPISYNFKGKDLNRLAKKVR